MHRHVFFDLDRTLWDFDKNSKLTIEELYDQYLSSYDFSFDEFYKNYVNINDYYWGKYRKGEIKKEELRTIRFSKTLEHFGIFDPNLGMILGSDYVRISPLKTSLVEGTIETLDYLTNKNYILHIITNGFEEVQHIKMKNSGLNPYFDQIIISEKIGFKKPDPRVFAHALKQSKVEKDRSVMVGDDLNADILGAKNSGWDQIYYNPKGEAHSFEITKEIRMLNEIKSYF